MNRKQKFTGAICGGNFVDGESPSFVPEHGRWVKTNCCGRNKRANQTRMYCGWLGADYYCLKNCKRAKAVEKELEKEKKKR